MTQLLWAVDLDLSYTDSTAMFPLLSFSTGGQLDSKQHYFDIPPPKKEEKKMRRRKQKDEDEVMMNMLLLSIYFVSLPVENNGCHSEL